LEEVQNTQADIESAAQSEDGASEERVDTSLREQSSNMDAFMRGVVRQAAPASKPSDDEPAGESAPAPGDVKPTDGAPKPRDDKGRFLRQLAGQQAPDPSPSADAQPDPQGAQPQHIGRRGAAERIAELERQLAERDPETIRQQVLAEQQQQAQQAAIDQKAVQDAERFQTLLQTPDHVISAEDYAWREEQKELIQRYPEVRDFLAAQAERTVQARLTDAEQKQAAFWNDLRGQMGRLASRKGVDQPTYAKLGTFEAMGDHLYTAGAKSRDPEVEALQRDLREARAELERHAPFNGARGPGSGRAPVPAGRSGNGAPDRNDMNAFIRGNFGRR
jgi:hypothetical protein